MARKFDVIVVGAGILGLAHAFHAAEQNLKVLVIERNDQCRGASVRNFGMVATIAQASGECLARSMRTRDLWLKVARQSGVHIDSCGCLFVATSNEEMNVLNSYDGCPAGMFCPAILKAGKSSKTQPFLSVS